MHKAFIITGTREGKELNAVFFTDNDATPAFVHGLGIENIEIFQVAPKSDQPLTPALYLFNSTANETNITSVEIEIIAFDNSHQEMMRHKVQGAPHLLVPPVEGPKAQETLYAPTAHLIKGTVDGGTPVLAILIVKPEPGKPTLDPSPKVLKAMGITRISTFERVKYEENGIKETQLFVVERSPSANSVDVKTLGSSGKILSEKTLKGDPQQLLPCVRGSQIERLFKNGLTPTLPPVSAIPPSKPGHSNRPKKRKRRSR